MFIKKNHYIDESISQKLCQIKNKEMHWISIKIMLYLSHKQLISVYTESSHINELWRNKKIKLINYSMKPGKYQHYKGNLYEVIGVAHHSETREELVVYRALYNHEVYGDNSLWVRPKSMFLETVIVEGKKVLRFAPVNN